MIKSIAVNKQNIEMVVSGEEEKNLFIKIATVLDQTKIAKTLLTSETNVRYDNLKNGEICIHLTSNNHDFRYDELEKFVDHLLDHGMSIEPIIVSALFEQARQLLDNCDAIFCCRDNKAQLNIRVEQGVIHMMPMGECLSDNKFDRFFVALEQSRDGDLYKLQLRKGGIDIVSLVDMHLVVPSVVQVMVQLEIVDSRESRNIENLIIKLALKDLAKNEVRNIRKVSLYPNDHPLSKYKGIALEAESIFNSLINDSPLNLQCATKLNQAINRQAEFSLAPQIIMRSFEKLKSHFHNEVSALMSQRSN